MKIFIATLTTWLAWRIPTAVLAGNALAGHPSPCAFAARIGLLSQYPP